MPLSIRERILQEITTRLAATEGIAGRVYRSRTEAAARAEMPLLVVSPHKDPAERTTSICRVDRMLTVRIAVIVRGDVPDREADPILQSLHKLLLPAQPDGSLDTDLGGLALDVEQMGDDFEFAHSDGVVIAEYMIHYRHSEGDIAD